MKQIRCTVHSSNHMTIQHILLPIGTHLSGTPIAIRGYLLDSNKPGKHIYIQAGMHGGEVTYWIMQKLYAYLQRELRVGSVTLIPIANPVSWMSRMYFSTPGKFDWYMGKDWNRNFPGSPHGSLGERIADTLFRQARARDIVIDLHTSRRSFPFGIVSKSKNLTLANIMGLRYTYLEKNSGGSSFCMANQLEIHNVPAITLECGSHDTYNPTHIEECTASILRLLKHFRCIHGYDVPPKKATPQYYTKILTYRAPDGGYIRYTKTLGDTYQKGEVLFVLAHGKDITQETSVMAKEDGLVTKLSPTHVVWPGDEAIQTIPLRNIRRIL